MPSATASASALPPLSSSTIVTKVSSAITSMAIAVQVENLPMPVCSEMDISQLPNSICGTEETMTPVPEDFVRAGTLLEVTTLYDQSSGGTTSRLTDAHNKITVTMLGDAYETVNAGIQGSYTMSRTNVHVFQSLLQCIQQLESSNAENIVLNQRIADLETQVYQAQSLAAVYQRQEAKSSDIAVVADTEHKGANHKRKWSKNL